MIRRDFVKPTEEEIEERRNMYAKAEELGIDLLKFDDNDNKEDRIKRDIRKAIIFLEKKRSSAGIEKRLLQRKENMNVSNR